MEHYGVGYLHFLQLERGFPFLVTEMVSKHVIMP